MIREWAKEGNTLYIAAGPVLADGPFGTFGENKVAIPTRYYKVILDVNGDRAIGFMFRINTSSGTLNPMPCQLTRLKKSQVLIFLSMFRMNWKKNLNQPSIYPNGILKH